MVLDVDVGLGDGGSAIIVSAEMRPHQRIIGDIFSSSFAQHPLPVLTLESNSGPNGRAHSESGGTGRSIHASPLRTIDLSPCRDPAQQPPSAQDVLSRNYS